MRYGPSTYKAGSGCDGSVAVGAGEGVIVGVKARAGLSVGEGVGVSTTSVGVSRGASRIGVSAIVRGAASKGGRSAIRKPQTLRTAKPRRVRKNQC